MSLGSLSEIQAQKAVYRPFLTPYCSDHYITVAQLDYGFLSAEVFFLVCTRLVFVLSPA